MWSSPRILRHRSLHRALGILVVAVSAATMVFACGQAAQPAAPDALRQVPTYDVETFYDTTSMGGASFSSDGTRLLVSSDESGVFNVYSQPVSGGEPEMLTRSEESARFAVSWFPGDDRFLYTADQGGNELNHLYVRELDGSDVDLTPGEELKAQFVGWSGDESSFWVLTNEREPSSFDLYRYETDGYARKLVFENPGGFLVTGVSRDGRWVGLVKARSSADSDIYVWNTTQPDEAPRLITPHEGNVEHGFGAFTPDSGELWYLTDGEGEFKQLWSHDFETGEKRLVEAADWDVVSVRFSWDGRYRATAVNANARTEVEVVETATGEPVELPDVPRGAVEGVRFPWQGEAMAFYVDGDTSPSDLWVLDLEGGEARRLSNNLSPAIDPDHLVESENVRYESADGLEIPALLYRPHAASAENPVPAMVWVHGGPGGQSRVGYSAITQILVNHGYAVLKVNNRGSSGYGKTFYHLDDRKHGEADLADVVAARGYLEGLDWIDGERIGIIGGSYGGYMVVAAMAFEPEVFDVGIDIFGVTNWVRTLESIPPWWGDFRDALYDEMGDPATDGERLRRISPLFHASRIQRPLLVVQGANDPRVLQVESDEIVEAVRANGVPVEYVVFPDEGHGFRNKENRITAARAYLEFLAAHLKGEASEPSAAEATG